MDTGDYFAGSKGLGREPDHLPPLVQRWRYSFPPPRVFMVDV
jgi:hypothetical protein